MSVVTLGERLGRFGLDPLGAYVVALEAILVGLAVGWLAADLLPRWLTIPPVALGVAYWLAHAPGDRARRGRFLGAVAGVLLVAPALFVLPALLRADDVGVGWGTILGAEATGLLVVAFWVAAAVVGYLGWRLARG
ncbi:MAG: hypothetical protein ACLFM8_07750 [Halobacteriales archaeon]